MKIINATKIIAVSAVCMLAMPGFGQNIPAAAPMPAASQAQPSQSVQVQGAWVRATVAGQKSTGAFMRITAKDGAKLVGVSSPLAGVAEVHEMKMEGDIMRMRAVPVLVLPAGKAVDFKPGGYHVMLMDLKQPLPKDSQLPMTLRFQDAKGSETRLELTLPVGMAAPGQAADKSGQHGAHKH